MANKTQPFQAVPFSLQQKPVSNIKRIVILGAESTGKTTLCQDLADYFDTVWVGEYMRPYAQEKWDKEQQKIDWEDLTPIAQGQVHLENQQATIANRYLFCDTSLFEIMVYAYWYYKDCPSAIEHAALQHYYDLTLLTEVDVPWEPDDLRDIPHARNEITDAFIATLKKHNKSFRRIGGNRQARVEQVARWLQDLS